MCFFCAYFISGGTFGIIYKKDIDYMREKIEKLAKEIWDIQPCY